MVWPRLGRPPLGRNTQVHTTDVAETRAQYLRAHRASSPRSHCRPALCLHPPAAPGRTTGQRTVDIRNFSGSEHIHSATAKPDSPAPGHCVRVVPPPAHTAMENWLELIRLCRSMLLRPP